MEEKFGNVVNEELICKNCASFTIETGYELALCKECRTILSRRPFPIWIKIFFLIVIIILAIALLKFPLTIASAIDYERGSKAEEERKYISALREYKKVADRYPDSIPVLAKMFIAYFKNGKVIEASNTLKTIEGRDLSDTKLLKQVNDTIAMMNSFYDYNKQLLEILEQQKTDKVDLTLSKLKLYTEKNPKDSLGYVHLGNALFDMGKYLEAKDMYLNALAINPNLYFVRLNIASVYRQIGEIDKAITECNKVLEQNAESVAAYCSLSRIELKRHKYKSALELAQKAYNLDEKNLSAVDTLALAYHYTNMTKERDQLLKTLKKAGYSDLERTMAIIEGKLNLYD